MGIKTGMLFILDRDTGDVLRVLDQKPADSVTWSIAWSPAGRYIVYGTSNGEVYRWDLKDPSNAPALFAGTRGQKSNRVRKLAFLDASRFVCVTEDGWVTVREVNDLASKNARQVGGFTRGELIYASISPDHRWLAAAFQNASGEIGAKIQRVELLDFRKLLN